MNKVNFSIFKNHIFSLLKRVLTVVGAMKIVKAPIIILLSKLKWEIQLRIMEIAVNKNMSKSRRQS